MTFRDRLRAASGWFVKIVLWIGKALFQDWMLRALKRYVVPAVVSVIGLGGAADSVIDAATKAESLEKEPPVTKSRDEVANEFKRRSPTPSETPVEEPDRPDGPSFTFYPLECTDSRGHTGTFEAVVFSRAYSWTLSSDEGVRLNENTADYRSVLRSPGMAEYLDAPRVIVVGTASCEGYPENKREEIERAGRRARQLLAWISEVRRPRSHPGEHVPVKALNLGVYARRCTAEDTWWQRQVVLLALYDMDPELSLRDCLLSALRKEPDLRHLATRYEPGFGPGQAFFEASE